MRVAAVAIQLGKIDDAYKLYASCQRYDLLNLLYQVFASPFTHTNLETIHIGNYQCSFGSCKASAPWGRQLDSL